MYLCEVHLLNDVVVSFVSCNASCTVFQNKMFLKSSGCSEHWCLYWTWFMTAECYRRFVAGARFLLKSDPISFSFCPG